MHALFTKKRKTLILITIAVSFFLTIMLNTATSFGVSAYDDVIRYNPYSSNALMSIYNSGSGDCQGDYGSSWSDTLLDDTFWQNNSSITNHANKQDLQDAISDFDATKDIVVDTTQVVYTDSTKTTISHSYKEIRIYEHTGQDLDSMYVKWYTGSPGQAYTMLPFGERQHAMHYFRFNTTSYPEGDGCNSPGDDGYEPQYFYWNDTAHYQAQLAGGAQTTDIFLNNVITAVEIDYDYPSGYEGLPIETVASVGQPVYPHISLDIVGYELTATYDRNIAYSNPELEELQWAIYIDTGNGFEVLDYEYTGSDDVFTYTFIDSGSYALSLDYSIKPPGAHPDIETFEPRFIYFEVDGSTQSLGTRNNTTCEGGFCQAESILEDCSIYGWDSMGQLFRCHASNIILSFRGLLTTLFVPKSAVISQKVEDLQNQIVEANNFLFYPITYFVDTIDQVATVSSTCNYEVSGIYGTGTTINFCKMSNDWPDLWNLVINVARMAIVISLMLGIYHVYQEMFGVRIK
jgi:hypothetical protein